MKAICLRLTALVAVVLTAGCGAQPSETPPAAKSDVVLTAAAAEETGDEEELLFQRVADVVPPGQTSVVNGVPVKPKDWPALFVAQIKKTVPSPVPGGAPEVKNLVCTATLVGPKVLLTAAHCVDGGTSRTINKVKIDLGPVIVTAACKMHPSYAAAPYPTTHTPRNSADYALCLLSTSLQSIDGLRTLEYESVDRDTAPTRISAVLVTGYGCTRVEMDPQCRPIFGPPGTTLRAGNAVISGYPSAGAEVNYLRARSDSPQEAALCPGDSGGPLVSGATLQNQTQKRRVVGVNSSIAAVKCNGSDLVSRFSALGAAEFKSFSDDWIAGNGQPVICGINQRPGAFPCRA